MSDDSYEDLTQCGLSDELEQQLLRAQKECTFMWTNKAGEAFGVIMSYLPKDDGKLWLTCARHRARVPALKRFPRAAICVTSVGSEMGGGKTVTYKGDCIVHESREVKDWFYPEFSRWIRPVEEQAVVFEKFLDSPDRVVLEFTPDYTLSFNSELMWARSPDAQ
jgi:general stress protein 26